MQKSVVSIVIPAYNEGRTIGNVLSQTILVMESTGMPYEIVVVDDGSNDHTGTVASTYKTTVLSNGHNKGKGYALRRGFEYAQGDILVTIDSDGTHKPKEIPDLIHPLLNGADIVCGSRFLGKLNNSTTRLNRIGNFLFNTIIMILTGETITDSQTGFRAFKRKVLKHIHLESQGYAIETEFTVKSLKNGFTYREKPINCNWEEYNISKLKILSDGLKILKTILKCSFSNHPNSPKKESIHA